MVQIENRHWPLCACVCCEAYLQGQCLVKQRSWITRFHVFTSIMNKDRHSSRDSDTVNVKAAVVACSAGMGYERLVQFAVILCLQKPMHQSDSQPSARKPVMRQRMTAAPIMWGRASSQWGKLAGTTLPLRTTIRGTNPATRATIASALLCPSTLDLV